MIELGELEKNWQEFDKRNVRVVVVSVEGPEEAKATQADFPHLTVVADQGRGLTNAVAVLHAGSAPDGGDSAAPTTLLVDAKGTVCWVFRPSRIMERLTPAQLAAAIDRETPAE